MFRNYPYGEKTGVRGLDKIQRRAYELIPRQFFGNKLRAASHVRKLPLWRENRGKKYSMSRK